MRLLSWRNLLLVSHVLSAAVVTPTTALEFNKTEVNNVAKKAIASLTSMRGWSSSWDWGQGVGLYGIWKHYEATGDKESFKAVQDWYSVRLPRGQRKHVNSMSVFSTLASLYNTTHDPRWVPYLEEWGSWCMYNLTRTTDGGMQHVTSAGPNTQQLWIDTLMMAAIPLAKIGIVLNKPKYVEEAKRQFDIHLKYLYDTKADLFYHGWTFTKNNNFAAAHWARGNAWAAITFTEVLELLYKDRSAQDPKLRKTLEELQLALQPLQDKQYGGLWRTVLDYPVANGSYAETSASAGFLYSYLKTERKGWVPKGQYATAVVPGIRGVLQNIATDGEVKNVSAGTGMGDSIDFYFNIAKIQTMWGQAMAVMALTEVWLS